MSRRPTKDVLGDIDALLTGDENVSEDAMRSRPGHDPDTAFAARAERGELVLADEELAHDAKVCRAFGGCVPVYLTKAAWTDNVEWTDADMEETGAVQDQSGRMLDVLVMAAWALRRGLGRRLTEMVFPVCRIRRHEQFDEDEGAENIHMALAVRVQNDVPHVLVMNLDELDGFMNAEKAAARP